MKIYQLESDAHKAAFKRLSIEFFMWNIGTAIEQYDFPIEGDLEDWVHDYIEKDMVNLAKLLPPTGHLLLCEMDGDIVGMAGMRSLSEFIREIKRMYVTPKYRGRGIARKLLQQLIDIAKVENCPTLRLDSGKYMTAAHGLYRSMGFQEIDAYEGTEAPDELQQYWLYFELNL